MPGFGAMKELAAPQVVVECLELVGRRPDRIVLVRRHRQFQCLDNVRSDLVLHRENVIQVAIVGLGPQVAILDGINELRRDAHPITGTPDAAFEHVAHAELLRNRRHVQVLALQRKRRGA